jgi:hypothetical protein
MTKPGTLLAAAKRTGMTSRQGHFNLDNLHVLHEYPEEQPHNSPGTLLPSDCSEIFNVFPYLLEGRPQMYVDMQARCLHK